MKKLICTVFCCLLLISARTVLAYEKEIKALSATMVEKIAKAGKRSIVVADFTDLQGSTTELGRFLAEELSYDLAEGGREFEIVDRNHLKNILTEHKFSMSGLVDPTTVKELGRLAGVDAIVTGTVTPFGDNVRVYARVTATDTAKVIVIAKGDITKTKAIEELLAKGIDTGATSGGQLAATPAPKPEVNSQQQMEVNSFLFQLQGCRLSGQIITCDFLVTNKDEDRRLIISRRSRIFDNMGNEFDASIVQMGNESSTGDIANMLSYVANTLVTNIPLKGRLGFVGVNSKPNLLSLLEIDFGEFKIRLRNVPLATK
jgi:TolB-like protein